MSCRSWSPSASFFADSAETRPDLGSFGFELLVLGARLAGRRHSIKPIAQSRPRTCLDWECSVSSLGSMLQRLPPFKNLGLEDYTTMWFCRAIIVCARGGQTLGNLLT